ncbi:fructose-1,6-bisphosphatase [Candidatus Peregrinibacteria bacterium]|jgi:fructose-1,6-bisphosphatase I|nr:fructose-1,6-bisphosphatase [Candidatus Peregrinibacteria bacterium]
MQSLQEFLKESAVSQSLQGVVLTMAEGVKVIQKNISSCNTGSSGTSNASGDTQMALDLKANELLEIELKKNESIYMYASEEEEDTVKIHDDGIYSVAFDPLDGSSLIDTNLAIGTIFGVYESKDFLGKKGKDQSCAGYSIYGPRTTFFISFGKGVFGFTLHNNEFILSHESISIKDETKMFSPGNLRACGDNSKYLKITHDWILEQKTLRYSGAMVSEINAIFCKQEGIFSYPSYSKYPNGKLRLLYECAPLGFLMESCGGLALNQKGEDITSLEIKDLHQRTSIFIGSKNEVIRTIKELE